MLILPGLARRFLSLVGPWLLFWGCLPLCFAEALPAPPERGFPLIRNVIPQTPAAEIQNFDIATDPRGFLYVANLGGVLIYEGARWQVIPIGRAKTAISVAVDADGRVAVGGIDELGYLARGQDGLSFNSLLELLPPENRDLGQITKVLPTAEGFVFLCERSLMMWDGAGIDIIATFPESRPLTALFAVEDELLVWTREGLAHVVGKNQKRLEDIPGGEVFRDRRIDLILPGNEAWLVSVRQEGLFLFADGRATPFAPAASRWTTAHRLFSGALLPDGRWALGSILGGALLLQRDGELDLLIDTAAGLSDDFVTGIAVDHEGGLWLALNSDLARIEIQSPLSVIDRRSGLAGSVYHVARHREALWVATAAGLFTSAADLEQEATADHDRTTRMRLVPGLPPSTWSLLSMGEELLIGTADGLHVLDSVGPPRTIEDLSNGTVYVLAASTSDPELVWAGLDDGLAALRRTTDGWRADGQIVELSAVRSIVEREGVVWCASELDGIVGVELPLRHDGASPYLRRIPTTELANLFRAADRLLAVVDQRILRLDETKAELVEDPSLANLPIPATVFSQLAEDAAGRLWLNSRPPSVVERRQDGTWAEKATALVEIPARSIEVMVPEANGVVWLAAENGLYAHSGDPGEAKDDLPAPLLAATNGGRALFRAFPDDGAPALDLPADVRHLRISMAPLSFRSGLRYQTRLEPIDNTWSSPTAEPFAELTRLPSGRYIFHARTLSPSGAVGPASSWSFVVEAPWYRAPWALMLWSALALCGLFAYGQLRSRAAQRRATLLAARVDQQTVALRRTVAELSRAQAELQAANGRLRELSLQDELTSVANRRRLQAALDVEWNRAFRQGRPVAFILLDLDHFKLLNDTRGHSVGDQCLQKVAAYLDQAVRRRGDLLVRYGGEEFAVLMPDTDLAGALRLAEILRQGLEELAIPHDAAPTGHITASLGVAAVVPQAGQEAGSLIETADLALYRAKTAGRNQVCGTDAQAALVELSTPMS